MRELLLIGLRHDDINGPEKLERALKRFSPERILVEGNENLERALETILDELQVCLEQGFQSRERIDFYTGEQELKGYEIKIARRYADWFGAELLLMGDREVPFAAEKIRQDVRELLSISEAEFSILRKERRIVHALSKYGYQLLRLGIDTWWEVPVLSALTRNSALAQVDAGMESVLRSYFSGQMAVVTGAAHALRDEKHRSLFSRVQDLNPRRVFL